MKWEVLCSDVGLEWWVGASVSSKHSYKQLFIWSFSNTVYCTNWGI